MQHLGMLSCKCPPTHCHSGIAAPKGRTKLVCSSLLPAFIRRQGTTEASISYPAGHAALGHQLPAGALQLPDPVATLASMILGCSLQPRFVRINRLHKDPAAPPSQTLLGTQLLGVNCLRVPFSFQTLWRVAPGSKATPCNPASQADVRASVIPPGAKVPSSAKLPSLVCRVLQVDCVDCAGQTQIPVP